MSSAKCRSIAQLHFRFQPNRVMKPFRIGIQVQAELFADLTHVEIERPVIDRDSMEVTWIGYLNWKNS
jgi:hypothetical protein